MKKGKMKDPGVLESKSVIVRPTLVDVVCRAEKEFGLERLGNSEHFKLQHPGFKVEFDIYANDRAVLGYEDRIVSLAINKNPETILLAYGIKTPYLEEQLNFLRKTRTRIARDLLEDDHWLQEDERKTSVFKQLVLKNLGGAYPFLRSHILYRIKAF